MSYELLSFHGELKCILKSQPKSILQPSLVALCLRRMYLIIHVRFGKHAFEKLDQPLRLLIAARLHFPLIRHPFLLSVHHAADVALVAALVASTHKCLALKTSNHSQKWSRVCVVQIVLRRSGNREQVVPALEEVHRQLEVLKSTHYLLNSNWVRRRCS